MRKIKYKTKCKNLNELYVLFKEALKQLDISEAKDDSVEEMARVNGEVIAQMEAKVAIFSELKKELTGIEKKLKTGDTKEIRQSMKQEAKKDINELLKQIRK